VMIKYIKRIFIRNCFLELMNFYRKNKINIKN